VSADVTRMAGFPWRPGTPVQRAARALAVKIRRIHPCPVCRTPVQAVGGPDVDRPHLECPGCGWDEREEPF
jgi:hypothetical protein